MSRIASYQSNQLAGSSPAQLVAMMHDKAIASLREAIEAIGKGEVQTRWTANNRAIQIILHLQITLDHDKGGDIARNLDQLYSFMLDRLAAVDLRNDPAPAEEVIALLEPLRASWRELANRNEAAPAATAPAARTAAPTAARASAANTDIPTTLRLSA